MEHRQFKKLRISITNSCNMACKYCVPDHPLSEYRKHPEPTISITDTIQIVKSLHARLTLEKVRITGGEPLMHPHVVPLIKEVAKVGIRNIGITTNGFYLEKLTAKLKDAGLKSVNVSLDALDEETFFKMARKPMLNQTLKGIYAAKKAGLKVKINSVILKGINENQIIPLLNFGIENQISVRYLELMKMGYLHHTYLDYFISQDDILNQIKKSYPINKKLRPMASTSNHWEIENSGYSFGTIANETDPFCSDCDRLRLDSSGKIYGCIGAVKGISVLNKLKQKESIDQEIKLAMNQKQTMKFIGSNKSMIHIGG